MNISNHLDVVQRNVVTYSSLQPLSFLIGSVNYLTNLTAFYKWKIDSKPKMVQFQSKFINKNKVKYRLIQTYKYFLAGTSLMILVARCGPTKILFNNNIALLAVTATFPASLWSINRTKSNRTQQLAWLVFCTSLGLLIPSVASVKVINLGRSAAISAGIGTLLTLQVYSFPKINYAAWERPLSRMIQLLPITTIGLLLFTPLYPPLIHLANFALTYGGLVANCGLFMSDLQKSYKNIKKQSDTEYDTINESIHLSLSSVNIFTRVLYILSNFTKM